MPMPPCASIAGKKEEICFCHWATESPEPQSKQLDSLATVWEKQRIQKIARAEGLLHGFWQRNNAGLQSVQRQGTWSSTGNCWHQTRVRCPRSQLLTLSWHTVRRTKPKDKILLCCWGSLMERLFSVYQCCGELHVGTFMMKSSHVCCIMYFLKQLNRE